MSGVGPATQVRKIEFRFVGEHALEEKDLRPRIALTARGGMVGLRRALGFLPFISPVGEHPLRPIELQRDVVRLRNIYTRYGYLDAKVDYDVRYDAEEDLADVAFIIEEGPALLLRTVRFTGPDTAPPPIATELAEQWREFVRLEQEERGRFGEGERRGIADRTSRWLRNRGYPFGAAEADVLVDTAAYRADVVVRVKPGLRARIREFAVSGNETVPADQFTRQLPLEPGDWYNAGQLEEGRAQLTQLAIVRLALINVPRESADDSSVVVRVGVTENPPRLVRGEAGLASSGGLTSQVEWTHRSFLHGARTFTVSATAQTGLVALETPAEQRYRLAVTVFQPYVGNRHLSAAGGPFVEYRDDLRDRSQAVGFEGTLVYATSPLRSLSLGYNLSHREILDYGFGDDLEPIDYLPLLGLADSASVGSLGSTVNRSALTLDGSWGELDEFANPRKGYVFRPRVSVTLPGFNTSEYLLLDLGASAFLPLTDRIGFTFRSSAGRIFPFGRSVRQSGSESPFVSLLRLRDVTFSAGGTRDVRGWGSQLVGPKLPEVRFQEEGGRVHALRRALLAHRRAGPDAGQRGGPAPPSGVRRQVADLRFSRRRQGLDSGRPLLARCRRAGSGPILPGHRCRDRVRDRRGGGAGGPGVQAQSLRARPARPGRRAPGPAGGPAHKHRADRIAATAAAPLLHRRDLLIGGLWRPAKLKGRSPPFL